MIQLRYYQKDAVDALWRYFETHTGNPIVAMPTGTGKSLVIAEFIRRACAAYPKTRFLGLTHVKKLVKQDVKAIHQLWPNCNIGLHSAGLHRRDIAHQIIFGNMQSVASTMRKESIRRKGFGPRDIVLIDECHLMSLKNEGTYRWIIDRFTAVNPNTKVIGFTATYWRTKGGMLTNAGGVFTDVCYDLTTTEDFNRLVAEGYLAPLVPKHTKTQIDTSRIKITAGEFNKAGLEREVNREEITLGAVREMVECGQDRNCWLVFTAGIDSAENVVEMLHTFGVSAACVHSRKPDAENDRLIEQFERGEIRCLVNADMLTTGFDCPQVDLIGMIRPTQSSVLWVQMLGRGTRPAPGKVNCLVLDFAGNTARLGPINDVAIPPPPGQKTRPGDAPVKICGHCGIYNHASARVCIGCGQEFHFINKVETEASDLPLIAGGEPKIETFDVQRVVYAKHDPPGKPAMIRVSYFCGLKLFQEYVCLEHTGYARNKAKEWWAQRHRSATPAATNDALRLVSELRKPERIRVWVNKPYPEVLAAEW